MTSYRRGNHCRWLSLVQQNSTALTWLETKLGTASKTITGQPGDRGESKGMIYSSSDEDYDSWKDQNQRVGRGERRNGRVER